MNKLALVTGAGSGIGYAFAVELASRGYNLYMVALPGEDLEHKAAALSRQYGVQVFHDAMDLTIPGNPALLASRVLANASPLNVLINNAGMGSNGPFEAFEPAFLEKQITLNCVVPVLLTNLLLPTLISRKPSFILNMGSLGAFFPITQKEVYVASKSFIHAFTASLGPGLRKEGVFVCEVCPGPVNSNPRLIAQHADLNRLLRASVLRPEFLANKAVRALFNKQMLYIPGRINRVLYLAGRITPQWLRDSMIQNQIARLKPGQAMP